MNLKKLFMPNWYKCRRNLYLFLIVLLVFGTWMVSPARAGLTDVKDTLSDSRPNTVSNHTIQFRLSASNEIEENDTIVITFPAGFGIGSVSFDDIDLSGSTVGQQNLAATPGASLWGAAFTGQVLTLTAPSNIGTKINGGELVTVSIGKNATHQTNGDDQITNNTNPGSYAISISANGVAPETGATVIAIISGVTVSATITESLTFSIAGVNSPDCTLGGTATVVTTTASAVPFATMNANSFKKGCQLLTVNTNANDGYSLTSQEDDQLTSAGGATIPDTICDNGTCTESTGSAWATATANHGLGHTCVGVNCVVDYSSGINFRQFASIADTETAQIMMASTSPVTNVTSTVVYKLSVPGSQASGNYSNTVVYIATAQFD
jgi:hypothetical protein